MIKTRARGRIAPSEGARGLYAIKGAPAVLKRIVPLPGILSVRSGAPKSADSEGDSGDHALRESR
jgi:hypothetical protein